MQAQTALGYKKKTFQVTWKQDLIYSSPVNWVTNIWKNQRSASKYMPTIQIGQKISDVAKHSNDQLVISSAEIFLSMIVSSLFTRYIFVFFHITGYRSWKNLVISGQQKCLSPPLPYQNILYSLLFWFFEPTQSLISLSPSRNIFNYWTSPKKVGSYITQMTQNTMKIEEVFQQFIGISLNLGGCLT